MLRQLHLELDKTFSESGRPSAKNRAMAEPR